MKVTHFATSYNGGSRIWWNFKTCMFSGTPRVSVGRTCSLNWEASSWRINGFVPSMASPVSMRSRTGCSGFRSDCASTSLHICAPIALVCADCAVSSSSSCLASARSVRECRSTLELAKNSFLVGKEVTHEAVGVLFVQGQRRVGTRTQDTRSEISGEGRDVVLFCRGKFDEAGEVGR